MSPESFTGRNSRTLINKLLLVWPPTLSLDKTFISVLQMPNDQELVSSLFCRKLETGERGSQWKECIRSNSFGALGWNLLGKTEPQQRPWPHPSISDLVDLWWRVG